MQQPVFNNINTGKGQRGLGRLWFALLLFIISVVVGTLGFMLIEKYTLLDAFYMSMITLSTVGFTEVQPLTNTGQLFASMYILLNLVIFAYVLGTISTYIFEGELKEIFNRYKVNREVNKLTNHIIVCGYGRNGRKTCEELQTNGLDFVLLELNPESLGNSDDLPFHCIIGDATQDDTLIGVGIKRARAIITTLPRDSDNVFITLTARELNPNIYIISRASEDKSETKLLRAGANKVVMPDALGGQHMARLLTKPNVIEFLDLLSGVGEHAFLLEDITFNELKESYRNKSIRELDIRRKTGATIIGFKHLNGDFEFNPNGDTRVTQDDTIIIIGTAKASANLRSTFPCSSSSTLTSGLMD